MKAVTNSSVAARSPASVRASRSRSRAMERGELAGCAASRMRPSSSGVAVREPGGVPDVRARGPDSLTQMRRSYSPSMSRVKPLDADLRRPTRKCRRTKRPGDALAREEGTMAKAVGIDLGTTNSVVAATMEGGQAEVIPNSEGSRTTPSVVAFTEDGERLVGQVAKRQAILNSEATVYSAKRFIGRKWDEVRDEIQTVPYKVVKGPGDAVRFEVRGKQHAPEEISAAVLRKLADDAAEIPRRKSHRGRDHGPRLLQRCPTSGDQRRREDRRPRGAADHQRADRGGARLRPRQERLRDGPRLRPRRRHLRRLAARSRRRRDRGPGDQRRRPPRRRRLRQTDRRLARRRIQKGPGDRPGGGPAGAAAPLRSCRAGQGRALFDHPDPDQPAVHHRRRVRPEAPQRVRSRARSSSSWSKTWSSAPAARSKGP